ncbi:MAG: AbrB/MazE/SpoVT family DNA-binding domain-containing protein [Gammaproteobacteria bacterium]|nr:MAG: AbrB/MazE/SpoVT family DNA-binding domain-containing protein [Gammaproteobacteria bacterium]
MKALATTRLSSKGQIVIPEDVRINLGLHAGDQFVVVGKDDVIMLKLISAPPVEKFNHLIKVAREQASKAKLRKTSVKKAIEEARKRK